jgi:cytidine deaminase
MIRKEWTKKKAIGDCLKARNNAIARKTKVGATLYTDKNTVSGWNLENRCHKGMHAEEVAIMNARINGMNPSFIKGMIISFSANNIDNLTFACGHCRQALWEFTFNPDLLITEVDLEGNIIAEETLGRLYPLPYPRPGKGIVYEGN